MIQKIEKLLSDNKSFYIYGAGKRGKSFLSTLDKAGYADRIAGFIVENADNNPVELNGITVHELGAAEIDKTFPVYIAIADQNVAEEVKNNLILHGFEHILKSDYEDSFLLQYIRGKAYIESLDHRLEVEKKEYDEPGFFHLMIRNRKERPDICCQWRFYFSLLKTQVAIKEQFFPKDRLMESYEESYGKYLTLREAISDACDNAGRLDESTIRVFSAQHISDRAERLIPLPSFVTPIQVGAALTKDRICDITDDAEESISKLNPDFSECTALYYMWKNVHDVDYVGLFHYGRYIDISAEELHKLDRAGVDIVITTPMIVGTPIKDFFCPRYIPRQDWDLMERFIMKNYPEYEGTLDAYNRAFCYPGANLSIMRKSIFDEYAEFAFTVMKDIVEYYKSEGVVREDRYAGYLMENLTAMFVMHNKGKYKIAYTDFLYVKKI